MQYEVGPDHYQVMPPKRPSSWQKFWDKIEEFSIKYGGDYLIIGICVGLFILVNFFFPAYSTNSVSEALGITIPDYETLAIMQNKTKEFAMRNYGHIVENNIVMLFGSSSYTIIKLKYELWRFISANFLHYGFMHIAMNSFSIFILSLFAKRLKLWNAKIIFLIFFFSGIGANIISFFLNQKAAAGASGGAFGIFGALLAFFLWNKKLEPAIRKHILRQFGFLLILNLLIGISSPSIDLIGHAAGFVFGLGIGKILIEDQIYRKINKAAFSIWIFSLVLILYTFIQATYNYFSKYI